MLLQIHLCKTVANYLILGGNSNQKKDWIDKLGSLMNFCGKWRRTLWSWSVDIFCIFSTSSSSLDIKQLNWQENKQKWCWLHNWWYKSLNCQFWPLFNSRSTYFVIVLQNQMSNFGKFNNFLFLTQIRFFRTFFQYFFRMYV